MLSAPPEEPHVQDVLHDAVSNGQQRVMEDGPTFCVPKTRNAIRGTEDAYISAPQNDGQGSTNVLKAMMMFPAKYDTFERKTNAQPMPTTHTKLKIETRRMSENGSWPGRSEPRRARQFL